MNIHRAAFWDFIGSNIIPLVTVLAGVIAIILQVLVNLPDRVVLSVVLGLLCLLATQEIVERSKKLERIEGLIRQNLDAVSRTGHQAHVKVLNGYEWFSYLAMRIPQARKSIDDTGLVPRTWTSDSRVVRDYYATHEEVISSGRVHNRYIAVFYETGRLDMVERFLSEYGAAKGYFAHYFPATSQHHIPVMSFLIIDKEEVVVGFYHTMYVAGEEDRGLVIQQPEIVRLFVDYYDFLWRTSIELNNAAGYESSTLAEIRKQLTQEKSQ